MLRNKFYTSMKYLYIANNDNLDAGVKFAKVCLIMDKLKERCLENYISCYGVSTDELIPYYGSHGCKHYASLTKFR